MIDFRVGLKRDLLRAGMTPSALAKKIGVTRASIYFWLNGKNNPSPEKRKDAADALGVDPLSFTSETSIPAGNKSSSSISPIESSERDELILLHNMAMSQLRPPHMIATDNPDLFRHIDENIYSIVVDEFVSIPIVPYRVDEDEPSTILQMINIPLVNVKASMVSDMSNLEFVRVSFDTMEPTLPVGSAVLLDKSTKIFDGAGIYAFKCGGRKAIARLQTTGAEKMIISYDNQIYSRCEVDSPSVAIIGKATMVLSLKKI